MITVDEMQRLLFTGGDVVDPDGRKIGSVGQLFLDADSGEPAWVTVTTGLFGTGESFVPLDGATLHGDDLQVAYDKGLVKHAPRIEGTGGALSPAEERELYRHYGLLHDDGGPADRDVDAGTHPTVDRPADEAVGGPVDRPGDDDADPHFLPPPIRPIGTPAAPPGVSPLEPPGTPSATHGSVDLDSGAHAAGEPGSTREPVAAGAGRPHERDAVEGSGQVATAHLDELRDGGRDEGMVLRGEHAKVIGTEKVPTERVRLRRYTVTEQREITVPVTREEVRIEYDPAEGGGEPLEAPGDAPGRGHGRHRRDPDDDRPLSPDDRAAPGR